MSSIFRSPALIALILFLLLDFSVRLVRPLHALYCPERVFRDQHALANKLESLSTVPKPLDVLVLGSSLAMSANAAADSRWKKQASPRFGGEYYCYLPADFLASLIAGSDSAKGIDLSCPGAMIADANGIFRAAYQRGVRPSNLVLCVAPRDFVDNLIPSALYSDFYGPDNCLASPESVLKALLKSCFRLYEVRDDYVFVAELLARPKISGITGVARERLVYPAPTLEDRKDSYVVDSQMQDYRHRYFPLNRTRLEAQLLELDDLLQFCKEKSVSVCVVNMPLTRANLQLLPSTFHQEFTSDVSQRCTAGGARFVDLQDGNFQDSDFRDTVHLRASGGIKAFRKVAAAIRPVAFASKP